MEGRLVVKALDRYTHLERASFRFLQRTRKERRLGGNAGQPLQFNAIDRFMRRAEICRGQAIPGQSARHDGAT